MKANIPQQFILNPNFQASKPDFKSKEEVPNLYSLKIYVTEDDYFLANFPNIFTDYIINFSNKKDVFNWTHSTESYMRFWQCQLNFAIWCSTAACGISMFHLFGTQLPNLVKSVMRFHVYFTVRKLLSFMEIPLPGDSAFYPKNNNINISKFHDLCRKYNIQNQDFRFSYGFSHGMGLMYADLDKHKNKLVRAQYGNYGLVFKEKPYHSPYFGDNTNVDHLTNPFAKNGWKYFIPKNSNGLSKSGIQSLNDSIRNYVILILSSQVETRSKIIGISGKRFDSQKEFLTLFESTINQSKDTMLSDTITRFQNYITKAKIHLNYVIGPDLYLISDSLVMNLNISGYSNNLLVAKPGQTFGVNSVNENKLPSAPLMAGGPSKIKRLTAKETQALKPKIKLQRNTNQNTSHENVKLSLFLLSSVFFGLIMYFK